MPHFKPPPGLFPIRILQLPMTGTFLVDQSGTVRLALVDPDFTRRLDPSVVIARLSALMS